jgi:hypothetical protein
MSNQLSVGDSKNTGQAHEWDFLTRWILFVIVVSIFPTAIGTLITLGKPEGTVWPGVIGGGELMVGGLAIVADGAGSLLGKELHGMRLLSAGLIVLWLLGMVTTVSLFIGDVIKEGDEFAAWTSALTWTFSCLLGIAAKIVAKG